MNKDNPFFSPNGRIIVKPFRTDTNKKGTDLLTINYYRISVMYTYSIQAQIQKRIFAKFPHPQTEVFDSIQECKTAAKNDLKAWCDQNKLKKAFNRLVPELTDQLDLFNDIL